MKIEDYINLSKREKGSILLAAAEASNRAQREMAKKGKSMVKKSDK